MLSARTKNGQLINSFLCFFFCRCAYEQSSLRTAWETLLQEIITDVKVFDTLYSGYLGDLLWSLGLGFGQVRSWTLSAKILRNRSRFIIHFRIYSWLWNLNNYFSQLPWIRNTKIVLDFIGAPCTQHDLHFLHIFKRSLQIFSPQQL